ncbi:hypothetical protein [Nitrospirillum amazonense]|uniref:hypothetical protein n=1 Tax=Nitrospirillum amazonense TaxID=28077 RepID=UPI00241285D9|nr:hypothetical protein [Nitrospirillum amazonense]MDG3444514.1 hypothetical protein [Nitrospirillum amazonense]
MLTDQQRARLKAAVNELNAAMQEVKEAHGHGIRVYPYCQFNDDTGLSAVTLQITTGREIIGYGA